MKVLENLSREAVTNWFDGKLGSHAPFFYTSVDIRDSGFKIAPVDTNLFPAGFNNLSKDAVKIAAEQAKTYLQKYHPNAKKIAILAENFSRNKFYWDNINALKSIVENAGYEVQVTAGNVAHSSVESNSGSNIELAGMKIENSSLTLDKYKPDVVISNRDFTSSNEKYFSEIQQPVIPPYQMGWHSRRKSHHFNSYNQVAASFARDFNFDPWLISTYHAACDNIDFKKSEGLECVATNAEKLLHKITAKYAEYKIDSEPYLYIKADSGTFGMGIMTIKFGAEIFEMNKKLRNKMDRIKEGVQNSQVLIQEGVPTSHVVDGKTAEPFIYMINNMPVGAILRVNENRDKYGNLNSAGMSFAAADCKEISGSCEFSPIGIIARLAGLAALFEADEMEAAA